MNKVAPKTSRRGGISAPGASHKATITVRYYRTHRTHLLLVKKEDIEWLGLEPGEELTINFQRRGSA